MPHNAVTQRHGDAMRELAEHRAYRLSGYSTPVTCYATNAQISQLERDLWGDNDANYEIGLINEIISHMIDRYCH